jgi:hypothetical protein
MMMTPDALRLNGYRVLRVPASASAADIQKAADRMRQAEPGSYKTSEIDIPALGDVPRRDTDISAAVARLANPVQRLTDRLLWFCKLPTPGRATNIASAMDPAGHDAALRDVIHVTTKQGGLDESGLAEWVNALRAWHAVTSDDDYWFLSLINEDQGSFEAPASTQEVDAVRANAVRIAAEPLILAAREAALSVEDRDTVHRVLTAFSELRSTGPWVSAAMEDVATIVELTRMTLSEMSDVN